MPKTTECRRKARRGHPAVAPGFWAVASGGARAAVVLVLVPGLLAAAGCGGSPDQVFRNDVMSPRPPGIAVLQAQESSGLTVESWLHFRGSPKDIGLVLNSDRFTEIPQDRISFDFRALRPPSWWRPRALGPGLRAFECEDRSAQEPQWRKHLFINQAGDEVYFLKFFYD